MSRHHLSGACLGNLFLSLLNNVPSCATDFPPSLLKSWYVYSCVARSERLRSRPSVSLLLEANIVPFVTCPKTPW